MSLLPPNALPLERALEAGTARLADVDMPIASLWDPAKARIEDLPFLAWTLSVDSWDPDWSETTKRDAVARSIALHRVKGTRMSVEAVLSRMDELLSVIEWHEEQPRRAPHTFEVHLPIVDANGVAGGERVGAAFAEAVIRDVTRVKPLREHFRVVQRLALAANVGVTGAARVASYRRIDPDLLVDTSPAWDFYLQTEEGEPLQVEAGTLLDTAA